MKAFVTSIGETTTDLCVWSLERQGFDVELIYNETSTLAEKLEVIYQRADDDFIRVDADVIVSRNIKELFLPKDVWWVQAKCFGWYSQDIINGGVQLISKKALPILIENISKYRYAERPETQMFRLPEFNNPRRCITQDILCGIHGYKQNNIERVIETKKRRGQLDNYDFELAERLNAL